MLLMKKRFDGGKTSTVQGYWLIEIKSLFSIAILRFNPGSRENYHSHAFNALTWYLGGGTLVEHRLVNKRKQLYTYGKSFKPKYTPRENLHKVYNMSDKPAWVFTIRGPWTKTWVEYNEEADETITLTHGRKRIL